MPDSAAFELGPGIRVAWDDLDDLRAALLSGDPLPAWRMEGELGGGYTALRVIAGATNAGGLLLLAAARPSGSDGHDEENPQAVLVSGSGEVTAMEEALVSTQYAANGAIQRVGLELYAEGDDYPLRGAGDARSASGSDEGAIRRERAVLDFRLDGEPGTAVLEIIHT